MLDSQLPAVSRRDDKEGKGRNRRSAFDLDTEGKRLARPPL
jgi:hypothetical protein